MAGSRHAAWLLGPAAFGGARQPGACLNSEVESWLGGAPPRCITVAHSARVIQAADQAAGSGLGVTGMREKTGLACREMLAKDVADSTPGQSRGKSAR